MEILCKGAKMQILYECKVKSTLLIEIATCPTKIICIKITHPVVTCLTLLLPVGNLIDFSELYISRGWLQLWYTTYVLI